MKNNRRNDRWHRTHSTHTHPTPYGAAVCARPMQVNSWATAQKIFAIFIFVLTRRFRCVFSSRSIRWLFFELTCSVRCVRFMAFLCIRFIERNAKARSLNESGDSADAQSIRCTFAVSPIFGTLYAPVHCTLVCSELANVHAACHWPQPIRVHCVFIMVLF